MKLKFWESGQMPGMPLLPGTESADLRTRLKQQFQRARYGATCRTLSYPGPVDGTSVHYRAMAVNTAMNFWNIQRITERDHQFESSNAPVTTQNIDVKTVRHDVGFFDMIEYLARIEVAEKRDPVGPDADTLGNDYYRNLAALHEIPFDVHGMPQPTIGGHPVIDGAYDAQSLQNMRNACGDDAMRARAAVKARNDVLRQTSIIPNMIDEAIEKSKFADEVEAAQKIVSLWVNLMDTSWKKPGLRWDKDGRALVGSCARSIGLNMPTYDEYGYESFEPWLAGGDTSLSHRVESMYRATVSKVPNAKKCGADIHKLVMEFLKDAASFSMIQDAAYLLNGGHGEVNTAVLEAVKRMSAGYSNINGDKRFQNEFVNVASTWTILSSAPTHLRDLQSYLDNEITVARSEGFFHKPPGAMTIKR